MAKRRMLQLFVVMTEVAGGRAEVMHEIPAATEEGARAHERLRGAKILSVKAKPGVLVPEVNASPTRKQGTSAKASKARKRPKSAKAPKSRKPRSTKASKAPKSQKPKSAKASKAPKSQKPKSATASKAPKSQKPKSATASKGPKSQKPKSTKAPRSQKSTKAPKSQKASKAPTSQKPKSKAPKSRKPRKTSPFGEVQNLLFDKSKFTEESARAWLEREGYRSDLPEKGHDDRYFFFRQQEMEPNQTYAQMPFPTLRSPIHAVIKVRDSGSAPSQPAPRRRGRLPKSASVTAPAAPAATPRAKRASTAAAAPRSQAPGPATQRVPFDDTAVLQGLRTKVEEEVSDPAVASEAFANIRHIWLNGGREGTYKWMAEKGVTDPVKAFDQWSEAEAAKAA